MEGNSGIITVLVAVLGAFTTCLTFLIGKRHEKTVELRKIKEKQYIDFLTSLAEAKVINKEQSNKSLIELSVKIQTIYLVGSKDVQLKLQDFLTAFTSKEGSKCQSELYGKLIQSMKIDLYGKKWKITRKSYNSLDKIELIVFTNPETDQNQ